MYHQMIIHKKIKTTEELKSAIIDKTICNIRVEKINDDFSYVTCGKFKMITKNDNKYINATKLCNSAEKDFFSWKRNCISKEFINETSSYLNMSIDELIITHMNGLYETRGSYVHPLLITHIACWCGPNFTLKVSIWIEEWKKYSVINETKYWNTMGDIKAFKNLTKEKEIQDRLHKKLGGAIEVKTISGKIDLLTETQLIEIKEYSNWTYAIGQLIAYSKEYPNRTKIMYLFDVPDNNIMDHIVSVCDDVEILVKKIIY